MRGNIPGISVVLSALITGVALVSIFLAFSYYYSLLFGNYLHYISRITGIVNEPQMMLDVISNSSGLFGVLNISYPGGKIRQIIIHYKPSCGDNNVYIVKPKLGQNGNYIVSFPVCNDSAMLIQVVDSKDNVYFYRLDKDPLHRGPMKYWVTVNDLIERDNLANSVQLDNGFIACIILENVYGVDCDEGFNFTLANITVSYNFTKLVNFIVSLMSTVGTSAGNITIPYMLAFKLNGKNLDFSNNLNLMFNVTDWILVKSFSKYYSSIGALRIYKEYVKKIIINDKPVFEIHRIYDYFQTISGFSLRRKLVFTGGTVNVGKMSITVVPLKAEYFCDLNIAGFYYRQPGLFKIIIRYELPFTFLPISSKGCSRTTMSFDDGEVGYSKFARVYAGLEGSNFKILVLIAPPRVTSLNFYSQYLSLHDILVNGDLSVLRYKFSSVYGRFNMIGYYSTKPLNITLEEITFYEPAGSTNVCPGWILVNQKTLVNYVYYGGIYITFSWYSNTITFVSRLLKS